MLIVYDCFTRIGTLLILSALEKTDAVVAFSWPYSCRSEDGGDIRMSIALKIGGITRNANELVFPAQK